MEDYREIVKNTYKLLSSCGIFIFSQEHPFVTVIAAAADGQEMKMEAKYT
ncbi:MAG: hypothetical protein ACTTJW_03665 [Sphaerochaeta sp.]